MILVLIDPENHELTALVARLPDPRRCRVVEIGCGDGRLTHRYAARVESVLAFDPDAVLTASFRAAGVDSNVDLRTMSVDRLELPAASVDVVLFSWAL
jgi:16S rRNA A1518/A1519 N6-dimethyltransferase RsmA/KsgA/DIM1 with predicted DNA glycosylase/AP lyase activity